MRARTTALLLTMLIAAFAVVAVTVEAVRTRRLELGSGGVADDIPEGFYGSPPTGHTRLRADGDRVLEDRPSQHRRLDRRCQRALVHGVRTLTRRGCLPVDHLSAVHAPGMRCCPRAPGGYEDLAAVGNKAIHYCRRHGRAIRSQLRPR